MSKPGYPTSSTTGYSYSSLFEDNFGNKYPGTNSGWFFSSYGDKTGDNTPGWPNVKRDNYYMTYNVKVHSGTISYHFVAPSGTATGQDSAVYKAAGNDAAGVIMGYSWPVIVELYADAQAKLYNRLINQVKEQKVNYAQVFAERQQTVNLVLSTAKRLAESFLNLRRGNVSGAIFSLTGSSRPRQRGLSRVAGGIPEQWLALQYGWKPLLSDIYGSAEELARYHAGNSEPLLAEVKASAQAQTRNQQRSNHAFAEGPDWVFNLATARAVGHGALNYRLNNAVSNACSRTGLTNPLQLAWELLPYSFVVDWFYPVGNYLSQLDYSVGLGFERGWENMKVELAWKVTPENTARYPGGFTSGSWTGGSWGADVQYFQRLPVGAFPSPQAPHLKDPFSSTHVANALSLLATAFSSTSRIR